MNFQEVVHSGGDPLVQVDYVHVVDLDIGASEWENLRDQKVSISTDR